MIVVPLVLAALYSAYALFDQVVIQRNALSRVNQSVSAAQVAAEIEINLLSLITEGPKNGCAYGAELTSMRNLDRPDPSLISIEQRSPSEISCILSSQTAAAIDLLQIRFVALPTSNDLASLSRQLHLTLKVVLKNSTSKAQLNRAYQISLISQQHFVLTLASSASAGISAEPGARIEIRGRTLVDGKAPFPLERIVTQADLNTGRILFFDRVYFRASRLTTNMNSLTMKAVHASFRGGLRTRFAQQVSASPLDAPVWNHRIDYSRVYPDSTTVRSEGSMGPPLPEITGGVSGLTASRVFNPTAASTGVVPSALTLTRLEDSCTTSNFNTGMLRSMAVLRSQANFTINFAIDYGMAPIFCGLVRARELTVELKPGNNFIIGRVVAERIIVRGNGVLFFIDPDRSDLVPDSLVLDSSLEMLRRQFRSLEIFLGQAFASIWVKDQSLLPMEFQPKSPQTWLTRGCPVDAPTSPCYCETSTVLCWPPLINHPARSDMFGRPVKKLFQTDNLIQNLVYQAEVII